ncbi:MAG: hypothetical protein ACYC6Q_03705 [Syntrophales bacterium]
MKNPEENQGCGACWLPGIEKLPVISRYAKTRGWHYLITWLHRLSGIGIFIYLIVHICNISLLQAPALYNAQMRIMTGPAFVFFSFLAALLVGFHSLNGGRLVLYELFGRRNDATMLHWSFGLALAYVALVGIVMIMKNQGASPVLFWMTTSFAGAATAYAVWGHIRKSRHSVLWKLQRISGALLLIAAPAYLLFLSLNQGSGAAAQAAALQMQNTFVRIVLLAMATAALYHAGYGLFAILADYASSRMARTGVATLLVVIFAILAFLVFRIIFSI